MKARRRLRPAPRGAAAIACGLWLITAPLLEARAQGADPAASRSAAAHPAADNPAAGTPGAVDPGAADPGAADPGAAQRAPTELAPSELERREGASPRAITLSDPLLEPVERGKRNLKDWRDAMDLVRAHSADLGRARANVDLARAQSRQALAAALPQLTASSQLQHHLLTGQGVDAQGNPVKLPNPQTIFGASATLSVPIFDLGTWYDAATAQSQVDKSVLSVADTERQVISGLAEALVTVVTTERLAEVSRVSLVSALETLELTRRRANLGVGVTIDVLRAEQELARSRDQVVEANESVRSARDALGLAVGLSEAVGVEPGLNLDALRRDAAATCQREKSPDKRADLLVATAAEKIGERNVSRTVRDYFPTISFGSTLNYNAFSRFSPNGTNTTWTIGAVLNYDLYDGGLRYANRRARSAELEALKLQKVDLRRRVEVEVRKAERQVAKANQALEISRQKQEAAGKAARLAEFKFTSGSGSSFDLVDAVRSQREAELDVTVKEFQLVRAQVAAFLALATCDI
jgi:outer membrane protein TolC